MIRRFLPLGFLAAQAACSTSEEPPSVGLAAQSGAGRSEASPAISVEDVLGAGFVDLEVVYSPTVERSATDLAFNPTRPGELWVVMRELGYAGEPCNEIRRDFDACELQEGIVAIVRDVSNPSASVEEVRDTNAWHFMKLPPAIAFGDNGNFATCGEHRTGNFDDGAADFMGPSLWSGNEYGPAWDGDNGSHLDMLHATPWCMGIAHDAGNAYFLFNGDVGAIDWYGFNDPHVRGGADHSDGEASRWILGELSREPFVPSHLVFDPGAEYLYIADTGNGRVVRLDTTTGAPGAPVRHADLQLSGMGHIDGSVVDTLVAAGRLELPSGIELSGNVLFVSDHATSRIHAFDLSGNELTSLDTGLPSGSLAGIALGPDGLLYFSDMQTGAVRRVVPR